MEDKRPEAGKSEDVAQEMAVSIVLQPDPKIDSDNEDMKEDNNNMPIEYKMSADPATRLLETLVEQRYFGVLRKMPEFSLEVDSEVVARSWFFEQKVSDIVKINENTDELSRGVFEELKDSTIIGGKLRARAKSKDSLYETVVYTGDKHSRRKVKEPQWKIFESDNGNIRVKFEHFYNAINGFLTKEGFVQKATIDLPHETLENCIFVHENIFVNSNKEGDPPRFEGYVHNLAGQQIVCFEGMWPADALSTLRNFENKFFTSKFQLIFALIGYYEKIGDNHEFREVTENDPLNPKFQEHKLLFESSEPVGPLLRAGGKFSILVYDQDSDGTTGSDETKFQELNTIKALCTSTGKELYFDYCSMGEWKIRYVIPSPEQLKRYQDHYKIPKPNFQ